MKHTLLDSIKAPGFEFRKKIKYNTKLSYTFRWKHPPKSWWFANKDIYIDFNYASFGVEIFHIKKIYPNIPCGGWGEIITKEEFLKKFKDG